MGTGLLMKGNDHHRYWWVVNLLMMNSVAPPKGERKSKPIPVREPARHKVDDGGIAHPS